MTTVNKKKLAALTLTLTQRAQTATREALAYLAVPQTMVNRWLAVSGSAGYAVGLFGQDRSPWIFCTEHYHPTEMVMHAPFTDVHGSPLGDEETLTQSLLASAARFVRD